MTELAQIINKLKSYINQAVNAKAELYHSMEFSANEVGNTNTYSLGEWWTFCLEEYKEGYCNLLSTLAKLEPYLRKYKFQYESNDEDSDILTEEECLQEQEYLIAKRATENILKILSCLPKINDLVNKINLELDYLE